MQKPYFRDVWALGPNPAYPGAFPLGLINKVRKHWWGQKRLWLFSGSFKDPDGTTVDIKPELKPTVVANCEELPFESESFDFVFADPPYSEEEALRLYNLPYFNIRKVLQEMIRVCEPNGKILFLHRLVPTAYPDITFKLLELQGVVGIYNFGGMSNIRALTVWKKHQTLRQAMKRNGGM